MASRLSPFLPASDPRIPDARQGKVLSLHHLEDWSFTSMNTQLSRFNDLAAHPLYLAIQFRANGSHTQRAPDPRKSTETMVVGVCRVFKPFAWLEVGSVKVTLSRPTHQPTSGC